MHIIKFSYAQHWRVYNVFGSTDQVFHRKYWNILYYKEFDYLKVAKKVTVEAKPPGPSFSCVYEHNVCF